MLSFWATTANEQMWENTFSEINEIPILLFLSKQANHYYSWTIIL